MENFYQLIFRKGLDNDFKVAYNRTEQNRTEQNRTEQNRTEQNRTERLDYIDLFRGVGIILMIMGHIGFSEKFNLWKSAFHMPMFFYISGYFYRQNVSMITIIKKRAKSLLIPYVVFGMFHLAFYCFLHKIIDFHLLIKLIFNSDPPFPIAGALWFLTVLFFTDVFYILIDKFMKNTIFMHTLIAGFTIFGMMFGSVIPFRLPFSIDTAMVGMGFYHLARNTKQCDIFKNKLKIYDLSFPIVSILTVANIIFIFWNGEVGMRGAEYSNYLLTYLNAVTATVVGWNICKKLSVMKKDFFFQSIENFMVFIGKNSIVYVCLNQITILIVNHILNRPGSNDKILDFLKLLIVLLILHFLTFIMTKSKLKIFIGKF